MCRLPSAFFTRPRPLPPLPTLTISVLPFRSYRILNLWACSLREGIAKAFPSLLTFSAGADQRATAKTYLIQANTSYQAGSAFILNSRPANPNQNNLFQIANPVKEQDLCTKLAALANSLANGPITFPTSTINHTPFDGSTINLNQAIVTSVAPRSLLGTLDGSLFIRNTWPDPTLAGILPGQTQASLNALAFDLNVLQPAVYTPYTFKTLASSNVPNNSNIQILRGFAPTNDGGVYFIQISSPASSLPTSSLNKLSSTGAITTVVPSLSVFPSGITTDANGYIYVVGTGTSSGAFNILKITSSGSSSTIFTGGVLNNITGPVNGIGAAATFDQVQNPIVDAGGNVYIIDDNAIREISNGGNVSTVAGTLGWNGPTGYLNGPVASALFGGYVNAMVMDKSGNIYVSDVINAVIREISSGTVSTFAGELQQNEYYDNNTPTTSQFGFIASMAIDSGSNIFVVDECAIRRISTSGSVRTLGGTPSSHGEVDGTGAAAQFAFDSIVTVNSAGVLFVGKETWSPTGIIGTTVTGTPVTTGSVALGNLTNNYDGTPKPAVAITNPGGLGVTLTYNGSSTAPSAVGNYTVVATISGSAYPGSATATSTINKGINNITFDALSPIVAGSPSFPLTATASSGLPVSYTSSNSGVATVSGSMVTIGASGTSTITASQPGNIDYAAAQNVQETLTVLPSAPTNLTAVSGTGIGQILLNWQAYAGVLRVTCCNGA